MEFNLVFNQFDYSDANSGAQWNEWIVDSELKLQLRDVVLHFGIVALKT